VSESDANHILARPDKVFLDQLHDQVDRLPFFTVLHPRRTQRSIYFSSSVTVIKISTVDVDETWSITELLNKLQATPQRRNEWLVAFTGGVELEDKVVYDTFGEQKEDDYIARYDLSLLTPRSQPIRCKVSF